MKRTHLILMIGTLILLLLSELHPSITVQACSGGEPVTLDDMIDDSVIVVRAKAKEVDISKQNGIVEVESYLKGDSGPKYIFLVQTYPSEMMIFARKDTGGSCDFLGERIFPGDTVYLFLKRNELDGAYRPVRGLSVVSFKRRPTWSYYTNANEQYLELNETDFIKEVGKRTKQSIKSPTETSKTPRSAPLYLTTKSGSSYIVPVDRMAPIRLTIRSLTSFRRDYGETYPTHYGLSVPSMKQGISTCWEIGCEAISGNRMMAATVLNDKQILWEFALYFDEQLMDGQAFALAPEMFRIAVWNNTSLKLYRLECCDNYKAEVFAETKVTENSATPLHAVWSADSAQLAYTDNQGLWLWKLSKYEYKEKEDAPRLIIPRIGNVVPYPRYFSPQGHFLAITEGTKNSTLDIITGERLPDGLVSLDDRYLLTNILDERAVYGFLPNNSTYNNRFAPLPFFCDLTTDRSYCKTPETYEPDYRISQFMWVGNRELAYVACPIGEVRETPNCQIYAATTENYKNIYEGVGFDVEPQSGKMVILKDDFTITLDGIDYDLRQFVDSEITSIQWLPSLMSTVEIVRWI